MDPSGRKPHCIKHEMAAFEKVFQDGLSPVENTIIEFPSQNGIWYILRCKEHDVDFKEDPILNASAHLASEHNCLLKGPAMVIQRLGIRVSGCDKVLAEKDNSLALKAFPNESCIYYNY